MTEIIAKIDRFLRYIEKSIMFVTGLALFTLMCFGVLARYILNIPTPYQTEMSKLLYIWMCFLGGSYLVGIDGHPYVGILPDRVLRARNKTLKKAYFVVIYLLSLCFLAPLLFYAFKQIPLYLLQVTTYLEISYIWVYGGAIIGLVLMVFRYACKILSILVGGENL